MYVVPLSECAIQVIAVPRVRQYECSGNQLKKERSNDDHKEKETRSC